MSDVVASPPRCSSQLIIMASQIKEESDPERWSVKCDVVPGHYTGTGDLTAALLLAWDYTTGEGPEKWKEVLERVANTMGKVIMRTKAEVSVVEITVNSP